MAYTGESIYLSGEEWWREDHLLERVKESEKSEKTMMYLHKFRDMSRPLASAIAQLLLANGEKDSSDTPSPRDWNKLLVSECKMNPQFQMLMETAMLQFRWIILSHMITNLSRAAAAAAAAKSSLALTLDIFAKSLEVGQSHSRLERLELREIELSLAEVTCLGRGLAAADERSSSRLRSLRLGSIRFLDANSVSVLADGLQANGTLENVELVRCQLSDDQVAMLVDALAASHPRCCLRKLDLSGNHCRKFGLRAISSFLAQQHCRLRVLKLNDQFYGQSINHSDLDAVVNPFDVDELLDGLEENFTLRHLELSLNQLSNVDSLFMMLWKCPNIKFLDLMGNRISRLKSSSTTTCWIQQRLFTSNHRNSTRHCSRLQRLELSHNPFHNLSSQREENARLYCRLLECHPALYDAGCGKDSLHQGKQFWKTTSVQAKIQHYLDLNKTFGRTLVANNQAPLAIWPYVLERANKLFDQKDNSSRQANVIFHLLHTFGVASVGTL